MGNQADGRARTNLYSGREPWLEARLGLFESVYSPSDELFEWLEIVPVYSYRTAPHRQLPLTILKDTESGSSGR